MIMTSTGSVNDPSNVFDGYVVSSQFELLTSQSLCIGRRRIPFVSNLLCLDQAAVLAQINQSMKVTPPNWSDHAYPSRLTTLYPAVVAATWLRKGARVATELRLEGGEFVLIAFFF